ncbi:MAG TPA: T9SS type A sorting domain-containing protein, partial [Bacteroidota bacterium]|nr:T9SS type A sorting domain-containing protein [Bacteroidota bacterium]
PVLAGDSAAWDSVFVGPDAIVKKDSVYYMLYGGTTTPGTGTQVGVATSTDLQTWTKSYPHPVLYFGASGAWDQYWLGGGTALYMKDAFNFWYCGYNGSAWSIGYATSLPGPLSVGSSAPSTPRRLALEQNYPNPFNPSTRIEFEMTQRGRAILKVFDIRGAEVATILDATIGAGRHSAQWDARGHSSGVYFYRLQVDGVEQTKKMIILK